MIFVCILVVKKLKFSPFWCSYSFNELREIIFPLLLPHKVKIIVKIKSIRSYCNTNLKEEARLIEKTRWRHKVAERVFSILKSSFNEQQECALVDYLQASIMLQYNKR